MGERRHLGRDDPKMSVDAKWFRSTGVEESPFQGPSLQRPGMSLPQLTQETLANDGQIVMGNDELLAARVGNGRFAPTQIPRGQITPTTYNTPDIPVEKQVQNLVADFLDDLNEQPAPTTERLRFHVIHLASEMAPIAKVGGLGDVVTGLGRALQKKGHRVEVIIPKYSTLDLTGVKDLKKLSKHFYSDFEGEKHKNYVWSGMVEGLRVYFIDPQHPDKLFDRDSVYCQLDDFKRFTYFSRAALEFMVQFAKRPNIIHCHDWPVAVVAPLYKSIYAEVGLNAKIALTCHNLEPQGKGSMEALMSCGLQFKEPLHEDHFQDNSNADQINVLKSGLLYSDFVTTVSPTYAKEVLTPDMGEGLHTTLRDITKKFYGVVNGIDDRTWNPATDPRLEHHFSIGDMEGKRVLKDKLRQKLGLSIEGDDANKPLVCCVSRLVPQKGVDLLRSAIFHTLKNGGQFILQGTSQVPAIEKEFDDLASEFEGHTQVRLHLEVDEDLAHNIYAAADIFVIPSITEPCGLTQMYSMRYGTVPVVRKTGGLADTVFDVDEKDIPAEKRNGFTFVEPTEAALENALDRALRYCREEAQFWADLVIKVMSVDMSWDAAPVDQYIKLYEHTVKEGYPPASLS